MKADQLDFENSDQERYRLQAWRICRAWKNILGIKLNVDNVAEPLRDVDEYFSQPTPLADKALAEIETKQRRSKIKVLAEIKEPGGNRAQKGDAHAHSTRTVGSSVFED